VNLEQRIADRRAVVGVVGLGYVGLPLADAFAAAGFHVLGLDTDADRVAALERGEVPLPNGDGRALRRLLDSGRFTATVDARHLAEADAVVIAVPTPLGPRREPDLSHVEDATRSVAGALEPGRLVVLASTTWPGTTRDVVGPLLAEAGLVVGDDVLLAYAPEREDPGRTEPPSRAVPRVVGGVDERSTRAATALFGAAFDDVRAVSSPEVAEAAKLHENVYRAVNIALVNELKTVLDALDLDVREVIDAAATKPFGFQRFDPGPGLGGHCIPIDPFYLAWLARAAGRPSRFVELAGEINTAMPDWVVDKLAAALEQRDTPLAGARVLVLGLAYKADVGDVRESPALALIERLAARGARLAYSDEHVPVPPAACTAHLDPPRSLALAPDRIADFDAVLIATAHSACDWDAVARHARLVVDTRGVLRDRMRGDERYVPA
jgi:UDP-N-acetyl-D-glucosamine dehydrogenase